MGVGDVRREGRKLKINFKKEYNVREGRVHKTDANRKGFVQNVLRLSCTTQVSQSSKTTGTCDDSASARPGHRYHARTFFFYNERTIL